MYANDSEEVSRSKLAELIFSKPVLNFIMVLLGMTAAYFGTINSLKIDLAEKAEQSLVEKINVRLSELEVVIREGRVTRDEFHEFRTGVENRLTRIEFYLTDNGR